jgi:hypothetical protein
MSSRHPTRREFLALSSVLAASTLAGIKVRAEPRNRPKPRRRTFTIYRLSVRGRRGSRAAKIHNANWRFLTKRVANRHRAHPGDNSRIVRLTVSRDEFIRLFVRKTGGRFRIVPAVDLRKL